MGHGFRPVLTALVLGAALGASVAVSGEQALPDNRLGIRTAPLLLLSRPDVRADLQLDPARTVEAERAITDLFLRAAALKGKSGAAAIAERRAIDESQSQWLESHLSATQFARLIQIDLQWEGPSVLLSRPIAANHVGLSPEQHQALVAALAERNRQRARSGYQQEVERRWAETTLDLLSDAQKARWKAMLGHPFVPQLAGTKANPPR